VTIFALPRFVGEVAGGDVGKDAVGDGLGAGVNADNGEAVGVGRKPGGGLRLGRWPRSIGEGCSVAGCPLAGGHANNAETASRAGARRGYLPADSMRRTGSMVWSSVSMARRRRLKSREAVKTTEISSLVN